MLDTKLLEILCCPICKGKIDYRPEKNELFCKVDRLAYPVRDGVPIMLESEARTISSEEIEQVYG